MKGKGILKRNDNPVIRNFNEEQEKYWENTKYRSSQHPVTRAYAFPKIEFIEKYVCFTDKVVLDVGCGNGVFTLPLSCKPIKSMFGSDNSIFMLLNNPCKNVVRGDAEKLPYADNSFDIVFEANLLHHVERPEDVISEMKRVSKDYIIFIEQNRLNPVMFLFSLLVKMERGGLRFSEKNLVKLVSGEGTKIIKSASMGLISQNNTPEVLLPLLKKFDREFLFGEYTVVVARQMK